MSGILLNFHQLLDLVGRLDDSAGESAPREKFRKFLAESVSSVGQLRDYIEECCRTSGPQYNRALQDLVNFLGTRLGFDVEYGRYQGVQNEIGFDGFWKSPTGLHVVVEVKTTEAYAIKTATLVGYVDALIAERRIPDWDSALGLYIVGRPEPELNQLENSIIAEKRTGQLRIASVESLLSLAEIVEEFDVEHEDIVAMLKPSGPMIDPIVEVVARVAAQTTTAQTTAGESVSVDAALEEQHSRKSESYTGGGTAYYLTPVSGDKNSSSRDEIERLVGQHAVYAFGENSAYRKQIREGDRICFYSTGTGVVAHARVKSDPVKQSHPAVRESERYPWLIYLDDAVLYTDSPVVLDATLRAKLDGFRGKDPNKPWAWFVQSTNKLTEHDYTAITRSPAKA